MMHECNFSTFTYTYNNYKQNKSAELREGHGRYPAIRTKVNRKRAFKSTSAWKELRERWKGFYSDSCPGIIVREELMTYCILQEQGFLRSHVIHLYIQPMANQILPDECWKLLKQTPCLHERWDINVKNHYRWSQRVYLMEMMDNSSSVLPMELWELRSPYQMVPFPPRPFCKIPVMYS